jgi:UDP-glucose 4-epimerase
MQLTVLVTGGSGLIGKKTVEKLLKEGYRVISLQRSDSIISGVESLRYDACEDDWHSIIPKLNDISAIVHLGGVIETGANEFQKDLIRKVNIEYSENLINYALNRGVSRFVFASTLSFTKLPLPSMILENSELEPTTFYAESKKYIEDQITQCATNSALGFNILRISSPISESLGELHNTVVKKWVEKARRGETLQVYGGGLRSQDFVNTEDVAEAVSLCLKNSTDGVFNIASGNTISMIDLAKRISRKFGVDYELVEGTIADELKWQVSVGKAKDELGFVPKYSSQENVIKLLNNL